MTSEDSALPTHHAAAEMLMESIRGGWMMTPRERLIWGTAGLFMFATLGVLVAAPVWVYWQYGFEPAVIAGLCVIAYGVYFHD